MGFPAGNSGSGALAYGQRAWKSDVAEAVFLVWYNKLIRWLGNKPGDKQGAAPDREPVWQGKLFLPKARPIPKGPEQFPLLRGNAGQRGKEIGL